MLGRFVSECCRSKGTCHLSKLIELSLPSRVQLAQIKEAMKDTNGQIDTTDNGVEATTSNSLRAGPRGFNLLEDTSVRKKMLHFDRERQPERVVHALGHGAYGKFESYGDWSNMTMVSKPCHPILPTLRCVITDSVILGMLASRGCRQRGLHPLLRRRRKCGRKRKRT